MILPWCPEMLGMPALGAEGTVQDHDAKRTNLPINPFFPLIDALVRDVCMRSVTAWRLDVQAFIKTSLGGMNSFAREKTLVLIHLSSV